MCLWVEPHDFARPVTVLPAPEVEAKSIGAVAVRLRYFDAANGATRFFFGYQRLPAVERVRFAVPRAGDVAVAVERDEGFRARRDCEAGHKCEVATGGSADNADARWIYVALLWQGFADASKGFADIVDDVGKFCFWGKTIVDRDLCEAFLGEEVTHDGMGPGSAAADECAAVDPDDNGSGRG